MGKGAASVLVLAAALLLLIAAVAPAATRYAAPGGTGKDPCANPARPCSVYTAAHKNAPGTTITAGDVVELAPGTYYSTTEGEFGYESGLTPPEGVTVRGEPGKARPVIVVPVNEFAYGVPFSVGPGVEVADMEIRNRSRHGSAIEVWGGTVERVVARSTDIEPTCGFSDGTMRSSACLNLAGGPAIGINLSGKGTFKSVIRNSTLIATGPGSVGMQFIYQPFKGRLVASIDAVGALVKGEEKDVIAKAQPPWAPTRGRGADVSIKLQASAYATVETKAEAGGTASITPPGTHGNITATPLLAADNLHQLADSPTIDKGAVDGASSALDVDEQLRAASDVADIGADELGPFPSQVNSAPVTKLVMPPQRPGELTVIRRVEFNFGSSDVGSRFECKLDRKPYHACASPYKRKVKPGKHEFRVRAIDPQGVADPTPPTYRWQVISWRAILP